MNLFIDERTKVLKSSEEWDENSNFIHLCADKRRRIDDIRWDLDDIFKNEIGRKNRQGVTGKFPIYEKPRPFPLQDWYNALIKVMDGENLTAQQIFERKYIREIHNHQESEVMTLRGPKKKNTLFI